jgi:hypothetical protein
MKTKAEPRPLYTILPDGRWQFFIDHSTLKDFMMCEEYFEYRHVALIKPRGKGSVSMNVGSWWSRTLENIYTYIQQHGDISLSQCQLISADAWNELRMNDLKDQKQFKDFGGHNGAIVMIDDYYTAHITDDIRRLKIISAESGFGLKGEIPIGSNNMVVVYWVGKPDLVILDGRRLCPFDHKSVSRIDGDIHGRYKPHPQIAGYIFATRLLAQQAKLDVTVDRAIVNVCSRKAPSENPRDGKKRPRFVRTLVSYNEYELREWQLQTLDKVTRMRHAIEHGDFLWNENMCSNMYFKPCPYRALCSQPENVRPVIIQGNYDRAERWIPYQVDEEEED